MAINIIDFLVGGLTDTNNNVLAGGYVYTYAAGTTTPKATYTTQAGTTPHTNPIVLDSAGRKAAYGSGAYKFVIQNSAGAAIMTIDNASYGTPDAITYGGTSAGAANIYALTPSPAIASYQIGQQFLFKAHQTNTGSVTINISGLGSQPLYLPDGNNLVAGNIQSGFTYRIHETLTNVWVLENPHVGVRTFTSTLSFSAGTISGSTTTTLRYPAPLTGKFLNWELSAVNSITLAGSTAQFLKATLPTELSNPIGISGIGTITDGGNEICSATYAGDNKISINREMFALFSIGGGKGFYCGGTMILS